MQANMSDASETKGILYIVATPIGNMADITLRAIETLRRVDLIAAEDTRYTRRLLACHGIKKPLVSYHEHNEVKRTESLAGRLGAGESIALVSNAGTPTLSDPGYRLVREAVARNIKVVPVPGVCAAITALSAAGLPTDAFIFLGFLSRKKGRRNKELARLAKEKRTLIFYESPKRVLALLKEILAVMGNRYGVLARELTKRYEEFIHGRLTEIIDSIATREDVKGECTLVVAGEEAAPELEADALKQEIRLALEHSGRGLAGLAGELAGRYGLPRKEVYREALRIKKAIDESD